MARNGAQSAHSLLRQDLNRGLGAVTLSVMVFSLGPIFVKEADLAIFSLIFWRLWAGVLVMAAILALSGRWIDRRSLLLAIPAGLFFAFNMTLFFNSIRITSVAHATLISALQPIPMAIIGVVWFKEKLHTSDYLWGLLAICGATLLIFTGGSSEETSLWGDFIALLAMLCFAGYMVLSKSARRQVETREFMVGMFFTAAVVCSPLILLNTEETLPSDGGKTWLLIGLLALIPGMGHFFVNFAHKSVPLIVVSLMQLAAPVLSAIWAWVVLHESLGVGEFASIVIILISVAGFIVQSTRRQYKGLLLKD